MPRCWFIVAGCEDPLLLFLRCHHLHLVSRDDNIYIYLYIYIIIYIYIYLSLFLLQEDLSSVYHQIRCSLLLLCHIYWVAPVDGVIQDRIFLVYIHHSNLTANLTLFTRVHSRSKYYTHFLKYLDPPGTNFTGVQI